MDQLSMRRIIVFALLTTGLVTLIYSTMYLNYAANSELLKQSHADIHQRLIEDLGENIASQFYEGYKDTRMLASTLGFNLSDPDRTKQIMNLFIRNYRTYDLIIVVDTQGHFLCANDLSTDGKKIDSNSLQNLDFKKESWFEDTLKEKFSVNIKGNMLGMHFQEPGPLGLTSRLYQKPAYGSIFSTVVRNKLGQVVAVMAAYTNSDWLVRDVTLSFHRLEKIYGNNFNMHITNSRGANMLPDIPTINGIILKNPVSLSAPIHSEKFITGLK